MSLAQLGPFRVILFVVWVAVIFYAYTHGIWVIDVPDFYVSIAANAAAGAFVVGVGLCVWQTVAGLMDKHAAVLTIVGFGAAGIFAGICYTTPVLPWGTKALYSDAVFHRVIGSR